MTEKVKCTCPSGHETEFTQGIFAQKRKLYKSLRCIPCRKLYEWKKWKVVGEGDEIEAPAEEVKEKPAEVAADNAFSVEESLRDGEKLVKVEETTKKDVFGKNSIKSLLKIIFDAIARKRGEFWKLSADEEKELSEVTKKLVDKRMPKGVGKYEEEIAFVFVIGSSVVSKIMQDQKTNGWGVKAPIDPKAAVAAQKSEVKDKINADKPPEATQSDASGYLPK